MFDEFLKYWDKKRKSDIQIELAAKHGEAFMLSWAFFTFLGRELRKKQELPNKEYNALIADVICPRMYNGISRSNYDQVLKAIEREFEIYF